MVRRRRRRPRRPSSFALSSAPALGIDENGAPKEGQMNGQKSHPSEMLLGRALASAERTRIDLLLERRQLEGGPDIPEVAPPPSLSSVHNDEDGDGDGASDDDGAGGVACSPGHVADQLPGMTADELNEAYMDVYGHPPPDVALWEERLVALEREVWRLPPGSERSALIRAVRKHPLLFVNCPHTRMIVEQEKDADVADGENNGGDFDAALSARRLARYWDRRRSLFGDSVCYAFGTFPAHTFSAYRRLYSRNLAVADDPDVDEASRVKSEEFLRVVHDVKVQALDQALEKEHAGNSGIEGGNSGGSEYALLALQSSYELKVQFLRAEDMIETKAAKRMTSYYKMGLHLFGPIFRKQRVVTLADIDDCSVLFKIRQFRLMPGEDENGRSVVVARQIVCTGTGEEEEEDNEAEGNRSAHLSERQLSNFGITAEHCARAFWYVLQSAAERPSCQKNGLVLLIDVRTWPADDGSVRCVKEYRRAFAETVRSFPVKVCALHFIYGPEVSLWQRVASNNLRVAGLLLRRRFVVHIGEKDEIAEEMRRRFGVGKETLPTDLGGTVGGEYFDRWLEGRRVAGL